MRFMVTATLSVISLLVGIATPIDTGRNISPGLLVESPLDIPSATLTNRHLRHSDAIKDKNEERVGFPDLSKFIENLAYKMMLKLNMNPDEVFTKLHLAEAGVKLDNNPTFIRWLQYVHQYRKKKLSWFNDVEIVELLRKSQSDNDLVTLFHNLRQVPGMKNLADELQGFLLSKSPSSNQLMHQVWLNSDEAPEEVFKILKLQGAKLDVDNKFFLDWLRYTELYRAEKGTNTFTELQTMHYVLTAKPSTMYEPFGTVFQTLKNFPELKNLAESMQTSLFKKSIQLQVDPKHFGDLLENPATWKSIVARPTNDATFETLKAYTLKYAQDLGGNDALGKVKALFASNDPEAALAAAMKAS
ncbi:RxLR effector protein [Phytophthora megakarya]|uniref:RxLR effector protein n=1 Tax=Phytophthora megakarya TaxID=4795 RepID=A0A225VLX7_9STRA|nr:RxLR effector protein [Phytophthora megakarya]